MSERVKIAITMGDPSGIGAEIIVKALKQENVYDKCIPIVIGDYSVMEDALDFCSIDIKLNKINDITEAKGEYGIIDIIDLGLLSKGSWEYGKNMAICGEASFRYVTTAIKLAMDKKVAAVITAPISKESINMAGHYYNGHTEIFAEYTGTKKYAMLLANDNLRVIHVTTHCALREACLKIKKDRVLEVIKLAKEGLLLLGIDNPKIGVAGLNPHCSENGLFGTEEADEIIPAINEAKAQGIDVTGPESPDTIFVKCCSGKYDIVVAMYHDQGHIPLKLYGFKYDLQKNEYLSVNGINCTIGLPIVRASVDHGTAFGKAGEGRANSDSMIDAIFAGITMAENMKKED